MQNQSQSSSDAPSLGYALLGFFIPIAGLIVWIIEKDKNPMKAASAIKGAGLSVAIGVISWVLFGVLLVGSGHRVENTFGKPAPSVSQ